MKSTNSFKIWAVMGLIFAVFVDEALAVDSPWLLNGNGGTTPGVQYLGTSDNKALDFRVNSQRAFRLEPSSSSPTILGGYMGNTKSNGVFGTTIAGGGYANCINQTTGNYAAIGGGAGNSAAFEATVAGGYRNVASGSRATIAGGVVNSATNTGATVGGGGFNQATGSYSTVAGGGPSDTNNLTSTSNLATENYATVSGGGNNRAGDGDADVTNAAYATVSGGVGNIASGLRSTISGGNSNQASGVNSSVAGGAYNIASGLNSFSAGHANQATATAASALGGDMNVVNGEMATVAGGNRNMASGFGSVICGGWQNTASDTNAVVIGGENNIAMGTYSTVLGGMANEASGNGAFAAGYHAKALADGAFVWADKDNTMEFEVTAPNSFQARCRGGVWFFTKSDLSTGVYVGANDSGWHSVSDRNKKENVKQVDPVAVLEKVAAMPVSTWNFIGADPNIIHMGPMAQDFFAAFGLSNTDTSINSVDADGVALAAIQGMNQKMQEQNERLQDALINRDARLAEVETSLSEAVAKSDRLEKELAELKTLVLHLQATK